MPERTAWHSVDIDETARRLGADLKSGLSSAESAARLDRFGLNVLAEPDVKSPLLIFFNQFKDFMILLLIAAAVVSALLGEAADTAAIVVILLLNGIIGFYQEWKAEKAVRSLKELASPDALVIRDGETRKIKADMVVPGDLAVLEAGQLVPADIRLVEAAGLTGEEAVGLGFAAERIAHEALLPDRQRM